MARHELTDEMQITLDPKIHIFIHVQNHNHSFNFDDAKIVYKSSNKHNRIIIESALIKQYKNVNVTLSLRIFYLGQTLLLCKICQAQLVLGIAEMWTCVSDMSILCVFLVFFFFFLLEQIFFLSIFAN